MRAKDELTAALRPQWRNMVEDEPHRFIQLDPPFCSWCRMCCEKRKQQRQVRLWTFPEGEGEVVVQEVSKSYNCFGGVGEGPAGNRRKRAVTCDEEGSMSSISGHCQKQEEEE